MTTRKLSQAIKVAATILAFSGVMTVMIISGISPLDYRFWAVVVLLIGLAINHEMH